MDKTIIYYTGNYERQVFEDNIKRVLLENKGDLPLISVSQEPIDLGKNICVGKVGRSGPNAWRQFKIGAEAADTKFVCPSEADFLYPPEYYNFQPEREDVIYVIKPVYVLFAQAHVARRFSLKPRGSEGAIAISRRFLIERVNEMYAGLGEWEQPKSNIHLWSSRSLHKGRPIEIIDVHIKTPIVTFKTNENMDRRTNHEQVYLHEIPYWGDAHELLKRFV